jgi:hypothetical protein
VSLAPEERLDTAARPATLRVVVAMLTYRRPDDLAAAVPAVLAQAADETDDVRLLVVDNDPDGSARAFVEASGADYLHEPHPGIAAARNAALRAADDADVLVFVDDDERPREGWLSALLATYRDAGVGACVVGPVVSAYEVPLDDWVVAGRFFDRRRLTTGTRVTVAATNNLLLDVAAVRAAGVRFDEAFGLSGGSDTLFTRRLAQAGVPMVWCDEAVVTDVVPAARTTRAWVLHRATRSGNSASRCAVALAGSGTGRAVVRARCVLAGSVRVALGGARAVVGRVAGSAAHEARGLRTVARGRGMVSGALGRVVFDYARA